MLAVSAVQETGIYRGGRLDPKNDQLRAPGSSEMASADLTSKSAAFFWGKVSGQKCLDGFAAAAPSAAREASANKPLLGRPPKRKDAAPRVRRSDDQITCEDAASAGLQKPLGERPHKEPEQLDPEGRKSQAGQKRKQLPEQGQVKQGKGKQRGSLLAVTLSSGWLKCSEGAG